MNRAAVIEQITATQEMLNKLLALLESSEADKFITHLYQARKQLADPRAPRDRAWFQGEAGLVEVIARLRGRGAARDNQCAE